MTNGTPVRKRLELDARKHPVVFSAVTGTIFGVVAFAFMGLLSGEWDVSSLVSSLIGGLGLFGPFVTIWARRKPSDLQFDDERPGPEA